MNRRHRRTHDGICRAPGWTVLVGAVAMLSAAWAQCVHASLAAAGGRRASAEADLRAVHDVLRDNAPFMVSKRDSEAPKQWLETGFRTAMDELSKAVAEDEFDRIVHNYVAGFRDPHVGILPSTSDPGAATRFWPGFTVRWRGDAYEVAFSENGAAGATPPIGAVLEGCDGLSSAALADRRVRQERIRAPNLHDPVRSALSLFVDAGSGEGYRPSRCTFLLDARSSSWTLEWVRLDPGTFTAAAAASTFNPAAPFSLAKWGEAGWWIGIPDMVSDEEWQSLYASVEYHLPLLRGGAYTIMDLRGNMGGNSAYGDWLVKILWGQDFARHYSVKPGRVVYNTGPLVRQWLQAQHPYLLPRFDEAVKSGLKSLVIADNAQSTKAVPANPMKGRVYVLTDHACQSSCLNFLDQLLRIPNVMQVGTPTGADTIFGDLLRTQLPSGRGVLYFPAKAWIDRKRRSGESLNPRPALVWRGDLRDVSTLYRWLWGIVTSNKRN